jgi:hypothetical protein
MPEIQRFLQFSPFNGSPSQKISPTFGIPKIEDKPPDNITPRARGFSR